MGLIEHKKGQSCPSVCDLFMSTLFQFWWGVARTYIRKLPSQNSIFVVIKMLRMYNNTSSTWNVLHCVMKVKYVFVSMISH